jgi:hypothetical protein
MLKETDLETLKELHASDTKQLRVVGQRAFIGDKEYPLIVVERLHTMTCVRDLGTEDGVRTYEITPRGWQVLSNPEISAQLTLALGF